MTPCVNQNLPQPLISVIVPAHNYGHFIAFTLDSVEAQTYDNWECLVVDDGSTDNTKEVVSHYADKNPRIKYIYQNNQGLAAARNTGIRHASGLYIQFLDADDLLAPRKLEEHSSVLSKDPEVDIVYGSVRYFTTENPTARLYSMSDVDSPWMPEISGSGKSILIALIKSNIMVVNAPLIRRKVIDTVGAFDKAPRGVEDWDYWIRCAAHGMRFRYEGSEDSLALVRSHPSSMSKDLRGMLRGELNARKKVSSFTKEKDVLALNQKMMVECSAWLAVEEIRFNSYLKGGYHLLRVGLANRRTTWILCAFISPFISKNRFEALARSSLKSYVTAALRHRLRLS